MSRNAQQSGWVSRHRVAVIAGAVVLALLIWLVMLNPANVDEAEVPAVVTAGTATAQVRDFPITIPVLGHIDARPGSEAQLAAPAQTRVTRIYVGTGDRVTAGQPLVALDQSVWEPQRRQAEAALLAAQQAHDRAKRLVMAGVLARKDEEAAASALAQAQAALAEAQRRESLAVLRSPISGVVTAVHATLSQPVDVNQPLVEVVDPSGLEVLFDLSPEDAARVAPGAAVTLTSGSDSSAAFVGSGTVRGINASVDSTTGSVAVRASITAPARVLRVGETVAGSITVAEHQGAVVVPVAAIVPAEDGVQLFVVDSAGIAHATPVVAGARTGDDVEITSGLRGGETVVTAGAYGVSDGATIQSAETQ